MKIKSGKQEITYLVREVVKKFEKDQNETIIKDKNRVHYKAVAKVLTEFSNNLPSTAEKLGHQLYPKDTYIVTETQVCNAHNAEVDNPKPWFVDSCYIYLYKRGRKSFELDPVLAQEVDENLLEDENKLQISEIDLVKSENIELKNQLGNFERHKIISDADKTKLRMQRKAFQIIALAAFAGAMIFCYGWYQTSSKWQTIKKDMYILPYQPSQTEIDSLEGIWLCYTASPQARLSDPNRYHMIVFNVIDISYKSGYFIFKRYGASFDHIGYMQFESPGLISVYSSVKNNMDSVQSPRHSLMRLDKKSPRVNAISASWSFDVGSKNQIIGIREVYIKQGRGGFTSEIVNSIDNASCKCKIVQWRQAQGSIVTFNLKNQFLDTLADSSLRKLLDENSILLKEPQKDLIITDSLK